MKWCLLACWLELQAPVDLVKLIKATFIRYEQSHAKQRNTWPWRRVREPSVGEPYA